MKHILYKASQYYALTKPRVAQLAVFCAVIGMCLAARGAVPWRVLCGGALGIWLCASAAFAVNCWVERHIDARMRRTAWRPSVRGELGSAQILAFATLTGALGAGLLYALTNPLTLWLTLATFLGYAVVYTVLLKPATPQNIVIGGAVGAMPPALGWAAVTGTVPVQAWILVLIIFVWTPPHFWALALARRDDYARSGWPTLPLTHGENLPGSIFCCIAGFCLARRCCHTQRISAAAFTSSSRSRSALFLSSMRGDYGVNIPTRGRIDCFAIQLCICRCCFQRCRWTMMRAYSPNPRSRISI